VGSIRNLRIPVSASTIELARALLFPSLVLASLAALWVALADVPRAHPELLLSDVKQPIAFTLPRPADPPSVRYLPGKVGLEIEVRAEERLVQSLLEALPASFATSVEPSESGLRIRIVHLEDSVRAHVREDRQMFSVEFGPRSEDARLRILASHLRRPLPEPEDLGAHVELWIDAEQATAEGDLPLAKRLWEKLELASELDDLAMLRVGELYLMSGHVNEAMARLRMVSRRFPRSTGASLARLDVLHVETITNAQVATVEPIELAAETIDRRRFEGYAWLRAALLLEQIGDIDLAIGRLPDPSTMPDFWRAPLEQERERMLELAVAAPALRGDPIKTLAAWETWSSQLDDHPHRADLVDVVADAYCTLGLYAEVIPLLRTRLRDLPKPIDEGPILFRLANAYHALEDLEREREVVVYAVHRHPDAPEVDGLVRNLAAQVVRRDGLPAARTELAALRALTVSLPLHRRILAAEADFAMAYGDAPTQAQVLTDLGRAGWDDASKREPELAVALSRSGRAALAVPLLRKWIGQTTEAQARDRMAYHLAHSELELGHVSDAERILALLAKSGTPYGLIARARRQATSLEGLLDGPDPPTSNLPGGS